MIQDKSKAFPRGENENDEKKAFPGGERMKVNEVAKMVLGTTSRNRWKNLKFIWKFADVRRTICLNEDRPYRQSNPRNLLHVQCARLLIIAYSHARYFTEIYFSRIVILGLAGKKIIFKN